APFAGAWPAVNEILNAPVERLIVPLAFGPHRLPGLWASSPATGVPATRIWRLNSETVVCDNVVLNVGVEPFPVPAESADTLEAQVIGWLPTQTPLESNVV